MNLDDLEAEAAAIRNELASCLASANQTHLTLISFGRRLGRLEERIDQARIDAGTYDDRGEGSHLPG
jgi:hypothetical protein